MKRSMLLIAGLILGTSIVQAQTNTAPPSDSFDSIIDHIKKPVDWFSWGADLRIRNEYFDNGVSLTSDTKYSPIFGPVHEQDYFRYRGRVWFSLLPAENVSVNVRLAAEPREFIKQSTMDTFFENSGMQWRYGIFDNLNVQWKKPFGWPATLTVGRQDIFLGDGWLVGDGTPEDGSFTFFLDAMRFTYELKDIQTTIDAIGLVQYARPDAIVPTIGQSGTAPGQPEGLLLTDQNEKGAILWIANKTLPAANLDTYFIYKHDTRLNAEPEAGFGDDADIFTLGGRLSGLLREHFKYSLEGAYQLGRKKESDGLLKGAYDITEFHKLDAFGFNGKLTYMFKDKWNDQLSLCYEFLSGDNPSSSTDEMFDVLWGRWPRWSEIYNIYGVIGESRPGQIGNLQRIGPTWTLKPMPKLDLSLSYFALFADQAVPTRTLVITRGDYTGTGDFRGHYLQMIARYKFNKYVSAGLHGEVLFEGDYYTRRQVMDFVRAEMMFTF